jgi:HSP20 family molecular chaperone IbpA
MQGPHPEPATPTSDLTKTVGARYGTFSRSMRLPADAKPDEITASHDAGILAVRVPLGRPAKQAARTIEISEEGRRTK